MKTIAHEAKLAIRSLRRRPVMTCFVVSAMGIGIAAAATMFTVVDMVDFRPLPFHDSDRLVVLHEVAPAEYKWCHDCGVSFATFRDWRSTATAFESMTAEATYSRRWLRDQITEEVKTADVSENFFTVLGVRPSLGRGIVPADIEPGAPPVAVISDVLWRRGFGADPRVIGKQLVFISRVTGARQAYSIIGVMPPRFRLFVADAWMPLTSRAGDPRSARTLQVVARLRPGARLSDANSQLAALSSRFAAQYRATNRGWSARAVSIRSAMTEDFGSIASGRWLLLGLVCCVLAITNGNVAALLVARAQGRQGEFALRAALGASRSQLLRPVFLEGVLIAIIGGAIGALTSTWAVSIAGAELGLARLGSTVGLDTRVLLFVIASTLACAAVCGLAPARELTHLDVIALLRSGTGISGNKRAKRAQRGLMVAEVACTVILLCAAGLLTEEFLRRERREPGYDPRDLFLVTIRLPLGARSDASFQRAACWRARDRLLAVPEALAASCSAFSLQSLQIRSEGESQPLPSDLLPVGVSVSPEFFSTARLPIRRGRGFSALDRLGAPAVALISEELAKRLGGVDAAIGHRILLNDTNPNGAVTIVGVAGDSKLNAAGPSQASRPVVYRPFEQAPEQQLRVLLRARANVPNLQESLISALRDISSGPPDQNDVVSMEGLIASELTQQRFDSWSLSILAALTLALAAGGVSGAVAYAASLRGREIAIRVALGASARSAMLLISRDAFALVVTGVILGIVASLGLSRVFGSLLAVTKPADPVVIGGAIGLMLGSALFACYLPARRVGAIDPAAVLRESGY